MEVRTVPYFGQLCWEPGTPLTRSLMDRDLSTGPGLRHTFLENCSSTWSLPVSDQAHSRALGDSGCSASRFPVLHDPSLTREPESSFLQQTASSSLLCQPTLASFPSSAAERRPSTHPNAGFASMLLSASLARVPPPGTHTKRAQP